MTDLCREYGDGLYALCAEEQLTAQALEELQTLKGCFRESPDFIRLLSNMSLPKEERLRILDETLRGQIHPYLLNFLKLLCERGLLQSFPGCEEAFREDYNRDHGVLEAQVTTRLPLTASQRAALTEKLERMTGKKIRLMEKQDASVLGGVLLEMAGQRYDNTLRQRLSALGQALSREQ